MSREAFEAYQKIRSDKELNSADVVIKLQDLKNYLVNLCSRICPKGLKDQFILEWVFTNEITQRRDYESYCKANLFAASKSLDRIIPNIKQEGINEVTQRMLLNFICDLKLFVAYFDDNQDYSWLIGNTNSHISNFYFNLAENVFWNGTPGQHFEERRVLHSSTPFMIRQSIEYKIKRILGIDYLLLNGSLDFRTTEKCFKAIESNKIYYRTRDFDFGVVKRIHSWTNLFIHGGYRAETWRVETALNYLNNLFYKGKSRDNNAFSFYSGVEVLESDIANLRENTEKSIRNGEKGIVEMKWLDKLEVVVIKS